jgi:hypothetical protein
MANGAARLKIDPEEVGEVLWLAVEVALNGSTIRLNRLCLKHRANSFFSVLDGT